MIRALAYALLVALCVALAKYACHLDPLDPPEPPDEDDEDNP